MTADLGAIRARHVPDEGGECNGCFQDCAWCEGIHPYPCETVAVLAEVDRLGAVVAEQAATIERTEVIAHDEREAKKIAASAADRFRDILEEALGLSRNPGDDEMVRMLRERNGMSGPEPHRWRDFLTGAVAHLEANGLQIGGSLSERGETTP